MTELGTLISEQVGEKKKNPTKKQTVFHYLTLLFFSPGLAKPDSQILRHLTHLFPEPQ